MPSQSLLILNKFTLFKELTPFFLMPENKSNMNWFTVDNGYSVFYLLLVPILKQFSNLDIVSSVEQKVVGKQLSSSFEQGMIMSSLSGFSILVEQFPMKHAIMMHLVL
jgi:hypothetical protein